MAIQSPTDWRKWLDQKLAGRDMARLSSEEHTALVREVDEFVRERECRHQPQLAYFMASDGTRRYVYQCSECHTLTSSQIAKVKLTQAQQDAAVQKVDDDSWRMRSETRAAIIAELDRRRGSAWWGWYDAYLKSSEWRAKREAVLFRDQGMCKGCPDKRRAVNVHHLTYEHVGQEFLFELVSVCQECHDRLHAQVPRPSLSLGAQAVAR